MFTHTNRTHIWPDAQQLLECVNGCRGYGIKDKTVTDSRLLSYCLLYTSPLSHCFIESSLFSEGKCDCMERCAAVCVRRAFSVLQFYCYLQSTRRAVIRVCRMRAKTAKNAVWRWCARGKIRKSRTSWQCSACDVFRYFKRAGC